MEGILHPQISQNHKVSPPNSPAIRSSSPSVLPSPNPRAPPRPRSRPGGPDPAAAPGVLRRRHGRGLRPRNCSCVTAARRTRLARDRMLRGKGLAVALLPASCRHSNGAAFKTGPTREFCVFRRIWGFRKDFGGLEGFGNTMVGKEKALWDAVGFWGGKFGFPVRGWGAAGVRGLIPPMGTHQGPPKSSG